MSVSLTKGTTVSLTKEAKSAGAESLTKIVLGLGWDPVTEGQDIDLDLSAVLLGSDGKVSDDKQFVYFNNLASSDGSASHSGDDLTGGKNDEGDDEQVTIDLTTTTATRIDVLVNSYSGQAFSDVKNLNARVVNGADQTELVNFTAADLGSTQGSIVARIEKNGDEWSVTALNELIADFPALIKGYGVNVG